MAANAEKYEVMNDTVIVALMNDDSSIGMIETNQMKQKTLFLPFTDVPLLRSLLFSLIRNRRHLRFSNESQLTAAVILHRSVADNVAFFVSNPLPSLAVAGATGADFREIGMLAVGAVMPLLQLLLFVLDRLLRRCEHGAVLAVVGFAVAVCAVRIPLPTPYMARAALTDNAVVGVRAVRTVLPCTSSSAPPRLAIFVLTAVIRLLLAIGAVCVLLSTINMTSAASGYHAPITIEGGGRRSGCTESPERIATDDVIPVQRTRGEPETGLFGSSSGEERCRGHENTGANGGFLLGFRNLRQKHWFRVYRSSWRKEQQGAVWL